MYHVSLVIYDDEILYFSLRANIFAMLYYIINNVLRIFIYVSINIFA